MLRKEKKKNQEWLIHTFSPGSWIYDGEVYCDGKDSWSGRFEKIKTRHIGGEKKIDKRADGKMSSVFLQCLSIYYRHEVGNQEAMSSNPKTLIVLLPLAIYLSLLISLPSSGNFDKNTYCMWML